MNIYDFADTMNLTIEVRRRVNWNDMSSQWYAKFESVDVKRDIFLVGTFGNGATPEQAIRNYLDEIRGKQVVQYAGSKEMRREFVIPERITYL